MAINFLNNINFNSIQVQDIVIENFTTALQGAGVLGQMYFDTTLDTMMQFVANDGTGNAGYVEIGTSSGSLNFSGGTGANGSVDLGSQVFNVAGTTNQIVTTSAAGQTLTLSFPTGGVTLPDGSIASTQAAGDNSAKVATDAFVTTAIANIPTADNYVAWKLVGTGSGTLSVVSDATITITGGGIDAVTGGTLKALTLALTNTDKGSSQNIFKTFNPSSGDNVEADSNSTEVEIAGTANQLIVTGDNTAGSKALTFSLPSGTTAASTQMIIPGEPTLTATPASGDDSLRIATTAFVERALTSALQFKGGFNANTGTIDGGTTNLTKDDQPSAGDERVAISVGDYYVVTTAGDFFAETSTPLTPGDSVIAKTAAAAGASVIADFIVVQSDTDLATYSVLGLGNVNVQTEAAGSAITAGYVGQATGLAAGGIIEVDYATTPGTAALSVRESTAAKLGVVSIVEGTGIDVTYADGAATIAIDASASPSTLLVDLDSSNAAITRTSANGLTNYDILVNASSIFGVQSPTVKSTNVLCEVQVKNALAFTGASAGMTVYAEITRAVETTLRITFSGDGSDPIATNNYFKVWLTRMA